MWRGALSLAATEARPSSTCRTGNLQPENRDGYGVQGCGRGARGSEV